MHIIRSIVTAVTTPFKTGSSKKKEGLPVAQKAIGETRAEATTNSITGKIVTVWNKKALKTNIQMQKMLLLHSKAKTAEELESELKPVETLEGKLEVLKHMRAQGKKVETGGSLLFASASVEAKQMCFKGMRLAPGLTLAQKGELLNFCKQVLDPTQKMPEIPDSLKSSRKLANYLDQEVGERLNSDLSKAHTSDGLIDVDRISPRYFEALERTGIDLEEADWSADNIKALSPEQIKHLSNNQLNSVVFYGEEKTTVFELIKDKKALTNEQIRGLDANQLSAIEPLTGEQLSILTLDQLNKLTTSKDLDFYKDLADDNKSFPDARGDPFKMKLIMDKKQALRHEPMPSPEGMGKMSAKYFHSITPDQMSKFTRGHYIHLTYDQFSANATNKPFLTAMSQHVDIGGFTKFSNVMKSLEGVTDSDKYEALGWYEKFSKVTTTEKGTKTDLKAAISKEAIPLLPWNIESESLRKQMSEVRERALPVALYKENILDREEYLSKFTPEQQGMGLTQFKDNEAKNEKVRKSKEDFIMDLNAGTVSPRQVQIVSKSISEEVNADLKEALIQNFPRMTLEQIRALEPSFIALLTKEQLFAIHDKLLPEQLL